jgi:hypothetical protein
LRSVNMHAPLGLRPNGAGTGHRGYTFGQERCFRRCRPAVAGCALEGEVAPMPHFIAVHPIALKDADLTALFARRDELPSSVTWHTSFVAEEDNVTYCEWDTPDERLLREIFEAFGVPYSEIHEVRIFEPAVAASRAAA